MKKIIIILLALIFFLLDWAALHDIIKGNEPGYTAEYAVVGISIIYFIAAAYYLFRNKSNFAIK